MAAGRVPGRVPGRAHCVPAVLVPPLLLVVCGGAHAWPALAALVPGLALLAVAPRLASGGGRRDPARPGPAADPVLAPSVAPAIAPVVAQLVVELLPDPLLVLAPDRSLRTANAAARRMLGDELSALLRHPVLRGAIDRMETAGATSLPVDLLLPAGTQRDLHATLLDLGPGEARTALALADRSAARAMERMRADFVANASHELRTPLASLIGFIDTLRGPAADDPPAQQTFLAIMAEQAGRMNRLIDDLLSLSRIELAEHLPPAHGLDLASVLARSLRAMEPRLAEAGTRLDKLIEPGLPPVLGDADQIEQVLQNLLDNALKYGRPGGVVRVELARAEGGRWPARPGLALSVRDDGAGIARVHLPRLTERFYRVDRGRSRAAGGTGLGLAIVKHIVSRHRGQLAIESEEGAGSTFSVWLPLAE